MKFSLSWLKEYIDTDKNLDEILHWLTMVGLEVKGAKSENRNRNSRSSMWSTKC